MKTPIRVIAAEFLPDYVHVSEEFRASSSLRLAWLVRGEAKARED
jgi:hypothetical protein